MPQARYARKGASGKRRIHSNKVRVSAKIIYQIILSDYLSKLHIFKKCSNFEEGCKSFCKHFCKLGLSDISENHIFQTKISCLTTIPIKTVIIIFIVFTHWIPSLRLVTKYPINRPLYTIFEFSLNCQLLTAFCLL
jgi:hypothetical protein